MFSYLKEINYHVVVSLVCGVFNLPGSWAINISLQFYHESAMNQVSSISQVLHLRLQRSLKSTIFPSDTIKVAVIVGDEFSESTSIELDGISFTAVLLHGSIVSDGSSHVSTQSFNTISIGDISYYSCGNGRFVITLKLPDENTVTSMWSSPITDNGIESNADVTTTTPLSATTPMSFACHIMLSAKVPSSGINDSEAIILSYISSRINLLLSKDQSALAPVRSGLCSCLYSYRLFYYNCTESTFSTGLLQPRDPLALNLGSSAAHLCPPMIIKEDYGTTLGSHVYDCSIILIRYLQLSLRSSCLDAGRSNRPYRTMIDLGAGTGIVSVWMSRWCNEVIATDKSYQLPLIQTNADINHTTNVRVLPLDWEDQAAVGSLSGELGDQIDLIIAADVLYDKDAAKLLLKTINTLISSSRNIGIEVLIAQKIRKGNASVAASELQLMDGLQGHAVHVEANVIVWKFMTPVPKGLQI